MLGKDHEYASIVSIEAAEILFTDGIAVVVTDGGYIELEKEERNE